MLLQFFSTDFFHSFFSLVSLAGNPVFWIIASALLYWKGEEKESIFLMNTIVFAAIFAGVLKNFFKVQRPVQAFAENSFSLEDRFKLGIDTYSFPSGHAATVSAAFVFFYSKIKKNAKIFFALTVLLVMASRVYLGKHFLADVFAGLAVGIAAGILANQFNEFFVKIKNHFFQRWLGAIVMAVLFLAIVFLFENLEITAIPLGYYAGIFLFKELGKDSPKLSGSRFLKKAFFGLFGFGAIFLGILLSDPKSTVILFFLLGLWLTFIFPLFYEIITLKKTTKH